MTTPSISTALQRLTGSVGFWSRSGQLPKLFAQMAMAAESTGKRDVHDGLVGMFQQLLRSFNALLKQVLVRRGADRLLEQVTEMKLAHG
jgi:hypothetical protein